MKALAVGMAVVGLALSAAAGEPLDSATVTVRITVAPIAEIDFPEENGAFTITVPENASPQGATIQPVRIPFTVKGNATASVSAAPGAFLFVDDEARHLGEAQGSDGALGYDVVVAFPVASANHAGLPGRGGFGSFPNRDGIERLPGEDGVGTVELTADMPAEDYEAHGVMHVVARRDWTLDGEAAAPGDYDGGVQVTVTAD